MARGIEHWLVEAVTFVTATHLTKSDSNKSAAAKIALVLSLAVILARNYLFLNSQTHCDGILRVRFRVSCDINHKISHSATASSSLRVNNWCGIYKRLLLRRDGSRLDQI